MCFWVSQVFAGEKRRSFRYNSVALKMRALARETFGRYWNLKAVGSTSVICDWWFSTDEAYILEYRQGRYTTQIAKYCDWTKNEWKGFVLKMALTKDIASKGSRGLKSVSM